MNISTGAIASAASANQTAVDACLTLLKAVGYSLSGSAVASFTAVDDHDDHDDHGGDHGGDHEHSHGFCSGVEGNYSVGLHVASVFVVLVTSAVGALLPLLGKRVPAMRLPGFVYCVGKCVAAGVMLSVALIHMVGHASSAFEADCVPPSFASQYEAWASLLAMVTAVVMHCVDQVAADVAAGWTAQQTAAGEEESVNRQSAKCTAEECLEGEPSADPGNGASKTIPHESPHGAAPLSTTSGGEHQHHCSYQLSDTAPLACVGHQHGAVAPSNTPRLQRVVAAVCMEFGVTFHSVFVGLTLGLAADREVRVLLVALVFHQLFEGLAMGAKLADADMHLTVELLLMVVFSFSAPVGVAAGTAAVSTSRHALSGSVYVMISAFLDSICGGVLLYLSFSMLFIDFPADLKRYCPRQTKGRTLRMLLMFAGVWVGAGVLALLGKWL